MVPASCEWVIVSMFFFSSTFFAKAALSADGRRSATPPVGLRGEEFWCETRELATACQKSSEELTAECRLCFVKPTVQSLAERFGKNVSASSLETLCRFPVSSWRQASW